MIVARTSLEAARVVPWANGRGVTRELLRQEGPDGVLILRLSVADVVEPGPFSPLPGIDRLLTLIEGPGFDLSIDGERVAVRPLAPVPFRGEAEVAATAVPGPSRDFNVMSARAIASATMAVYRAAFTVPAGLHHLFVVEGAFAFAGEAMTAGDLVSLALASGEAAVVEGEGALLAVTVRAR